MRLSGEMHNGIDLLLLQYVTNKIRRTNVTLDKLEIRQTLKLVKIGKTGTVIELVIDDNIVLWILLTKQNCNMGGDET